MDLTTQLTQLTQWLATKNLAAVWWRVSPAAFVTKKHCWSYNDHYIYGFNIYIVIISMTFCDYYSDYIYDIHWHSMLVQDSSWIFTWNSLKLEYVGNFMLLYVAICWYHIHHETHKFHPDFSWGKRSPAQCTSCWETGTDRHLGGKRKKTVSFLWIINGKFRPDFSTDRNSVVAID